MAFTASRVLHILCLMFCFSSSIGQQKLDGRSAAFISSAYTGSLGLNARLYNGPEYLDYSSTIKQGILFFDSRTFQAGSVVFDSIFYPALQLRYDVVNDILMVLHPTSSVSIQLRNETISAFNIGSHQFIHLATDSVSGIKDGFYERLYAGKTPVYARRKKVLEDQNKGNEFYREALPIDTYFVLKDNMFHPVKSSKALIRIFKGKEKAIQQHLRQQKTLFRDNKELAIIQAASYFDQLTN